MSPPHKVNVGLQLNSQSIRRIGRPIRVCTQFGGPQWRGALCHGTIGTMVNPALSAPFFPTLSLVSPKVPHVLLEVGVWDTKREGTRLIVHAVNFQDF